MKFKQYEKYYNMRSEIDEWLGEIAEQLFSRMVDLALAGKWQKWAKKQPVGTVFEFSYEMICDTGDANVDALVELLDTIGDTQKAISWEKSEVKLRL
ncbi:MAG: hypothetical protein LBB79_09830 [Prevotellaceae bacterium]|nr:hypothetical protein [Prevotellaceae bacterium]